LVGSPIVLARCPLEMAKTRPDGHSAEVTRLVCRLQFLRDASAERRTTVSNRLFRIILIPAFVLAALSVWAAPASAQRRGGFRPRVVITGGFYRPFGFYDFYDPWYSPWYQYGPYAPWGPYGPYDGPYGGGYYRIDELTSSLRLEVSPKAAEVFVDGYRAGIVDDFDGFFQRLRVRPGEHELVLYLDGYRTVRQQVSLRPGADQKVQYTMVPLPPGEKAEARPVPPPEPPQGDSQNPPQNYGRRGGPPQAPPQRMPPPSAPRTPAPSPADSRYGSVSIRVQPADADVMIDGERWSGPASQDRLVVQLSEGRHHVDVKKDGFEQYSSDVQVRRGETVTLNVSLLRRAEQR